LDDDVLAQWGDEEAEAEVEADEDYPKVEYQEAEGKGTLFQQ
jgi:hypothetical protein